MIHIFEPHGDDALISCYPILKKSADSTVVVTVGQSRNSEGLIKHFPGLRTHYEGVYEIPNQIGRAAYLNGFRSWQKEFEAQSLDYRNTHRDARSAWQWQRDVTADHNGELWMESFSATWEYVDAYLADLYNNNSHGTQHLILAPVGLLHPFHVALADVIQHLSFDYPLLSFGFYSEAPYNSGKWVRQIEDSHPFVRHNFSETGKLGSFSCGNDGSEEKVKEAIFRDVYPTEVKIFRFTRDEVLNNPYRFYLPITWAHIL